MIFDIIEAGANPFEVVALCILMFLTGFYVSKAFYIHKEQKKQHKEEDQK